MAALVLAVSATADAAPAPSTSDQAVIVSLERAVTQCTASADLGAHRLARMFGPRAAPAYVDPAQFREVDVSVGSAPYVLGGTLTLPRGTAPFPAVVLVHGSGPIDRDESVGKTKIFRDLAHGLASAGIAVLRYDKRTYAYRDELTNDITIDDEVISDAVAAVKLLSARTDIDAARVFVIGHSLGGLLAPEIALRAGGVAGVALLAPPGREPWEIVREQARFLGAPREIITQTETASIELSLGLEHGFLLGMPYSYWRDWSQHDGVAAVKRLARRTLVLHGTRDWQVTSTDFATWRDGLAKERYVELVTLKGVNHFFLASDEHVDARVVAKLAAFATN